ncbi:hypothetical protein D3C85_1624230 [compost metagenome]
MIVLADENLNLLGEQPLDILQFGCNRRCHIVWKTVAPHEANSVGFKQANCAPLQPIELLDLIGVGDSLTTQ